MPGNQIQVAVFFDAVQKAGYKIREFLAGEILVQRFQVIGILRVKAGVVGYHIIVHCSRFKVFFYFFIQLKKVVQKNNFNFNTGLRFKFGYLFVELFIISVADQNAF